MLKGFIIAAGVLAALGASGAADAANAAPPATGNYIVVLKDSVADPGAVAAKHAKDHGGQVGHVYRHALKGYSVTMPEARVASLSGDAAVDSVWKDEPVYRATAATVCTDPNVCQLLGIGIDRVDGDRSSTRSGDGKRSVNVNVAVLDGGIDMDHPDLDVAGGVDCVKHETGFEDRDGHGTMVAGFIGARDNDIGRVGVAPGAKLLAVRVLDKEGTGSDSEIICGIDFVTSTRSDSDQSNDIAVANMSLAGPLSSSEGNCSSKGVHPLHRSICKSVAAGITYVAAASNEGADFKDQKPATYDEVLTATGIADKDGRPGGLGGNLNCLPEEVDDHLASFSNFATLPSDRAHTVAAPAACLGSTFVDGQYAVASGTSFAAPIVAGTVALCIASGPCAGLTPAQIIQKIVADAGAYNNAHPEYGFAGDPLRPVAGKYYGYLIRAALY